VINVNSKGGDNPIANTNALSVFSFIMPAQPYLNKKKYQNNTSDCRKGS
jgi:hypothetical protein